MEEKAPHDASESLDPGFDEVAAIMIHADTRQEEKGSK